MKSRSQREALVVVVLFMGAIFAALVAAIALCQCGGAPFTALDQTSEAMRRGLSCPPRSRLQPLADGGSEESAPTLEHDAAIGDVRGQVTRAALSPTEARKSRHLLPRPRRASLRAKRQAPPPALCCVTPCSGSAPAAITCGNGGDWTCSAGACASGACGVGAACTWMSVCAGRVEVCP